MTKEDITTARPPTLKTIAFMTGYSVTAVSRALKDAPDISEQTKERVRLVASQIGYRPSRAGLRLRTGKTQVISLILDVDEEIMGLTSQMVNGISQRLRSTNYHLVVTPYSHTEDPMIPVRYVVETGSADGVILSRTEPQDSRVKYLLANNLPFVTHGRTELGVDHPWVDYDNERFAYDAVKRLAGLGAKKIGMIAPASNLTYSGHLKTGYAKAMAEFNLGIYPIEGLTIDDSLDRVEEAVAEIMNRADRPDALISSAGSAAMAAAAGIERAGLSIGADVQLVSKQSTNILHRYRSEIIVFHEDVHDAGQQLAAQILQSVNGSPTRNLNHLAYEGELRRATGKR